MKLLVQKGKTSFLACVFIQDSSSTVGAGLSGLVFNTSGLVCYRARADDGNAAGTQVTLATATLGTWATGGFKEKDATNMKGVYEIGITNASLATGSDYCILYFSGATNMAPLVLEIQLVAFDPDAATNLGLTALPTANPGAAGGVFIAGTNAATTITSAGGDALTLSSTGTNGNGLNISGNGSGHAFKMTGGATGNAMTLIGGATSGDGLNVTTTSGHGFNIAATGSSKHGITATGGNAGTSDGIKGAAGTGGVDIRGNITGNITGTLSTVTTLTNLPSIPANWLTAAGIAAAALNGKGDWNTTTPPTVAAIATGVWQDTTAGDFTTALSVGKSVMNGVALGTGLTINQLTTNNDKTGYSLTQAFPTNFSALLISAGGHISNVDTLTTYTGNTVQTGDAYVRLGAPAGASTAADIAAVKSDTGTTLTDAVAIKAQTDKLAFTVANQVDANTLSINGNATAAANVSKANQALVRGTVGSSSTTTSIICSAITSPSSLGASGQLIGRTIVFDANTTTGNLQSQATNITANTTGATPTFTVTALTTAPVSGDTFTVV